MDTQSVTGTTSASNSSFASAREAIFLVSTTEGRKIYRISGSNFDIPAKYSVVDVLGHGSYGVVVSAVDDTTGQGVAIKKVSRVFDDLVDGRRILREMQVLRILRENNCRNVMNFHGMLEQREKCSTFRDVYMVTELCETDLYYASRKIKPFSLPRFKSVAKQILHAMSDMHALGIIHRDMKPSNVLLTNMEADVRICDFGLARAGMHIFSEDCRLTDYVVTRWYRAPEMLMLSHYHTPSDIWSVGCLLVEFLAHLPLFAGRDYMDQLRLIVSTVDVDVTDLQFLSNPAGIPFLKEFVASHQGKKPLTTFVSQRLVGDNIFSFLKACLTFDPRRRPSANELLRHPLFDASDEATPSSLQPYEDLDWGFDHTVNITEPYLRRKLWDEIKRSEMK